MELHRMRRYISMLFILVFSLSALPNANAQLSSEFQRLVNVFLVDKLQKSPGSHGDHYRESASFAEQQLSAGLNSMIASNISSFPLSSTVSGVTFDFSSGFPVKVAGSLGPIFGETATTLGKNKFNLGVNYTHLTMNKIRGIPLDDVRFTFVHQDLGQPGLGDIPFELDTIDLLPHMDLKADIIAVSATYGLLDKLDLGVAVPLVNVSMSGKAVARVNSSTFIQSGEALHIFGGTDIQPIFDDTETYEENGSGIGDIAVRLKFQLTADQNMDMGALLDLRLPTGDEKNFLGTGDFGARIAWLVSRKIGDFTPHLNLGYEKRNASLDSDEIEFVAGFDQKLMKGLTFAAGLLGDIDINSDEAVNLFAGQDTIKVTSIFQTSVNQIVDRTNIPDRNNDNTLSAALGFRMAPSEQFSMLANALLPINDGGLRSRFALTFGLNVSL